MRWRRSRRHYRRCQRQVKLVSESLKSHQFPSQNFSKMSFNLSGFTGLQTDHELSTNLTDVNTTTNTLSDFNVTFAANNHRNDLPIYNERDSIIQQINDHPVVIITGQTGKRVVETSRNGRLINNFYRLRKDNASSTIHLRQLESTAEKYSRFVQHPCESTA